MNTHPPSTPPEPDEPYDMFEYPRLYPRGWNLNQMQAKPKAKNQPMPESYDKFPEPRTIPGGWDLDLKD